MSKPLRSAGPIRDVFQRTLLLLVVAGALAGRVTAQPVVTMVLNEVSHTAAVSPNCLVMILGYNLAAGPLSAPAGLPAATLGGTSVSVGGMPAQLLSVSADEIDALIPAQVAIPRDTVVPLVVNSAAGSDTYNIRLTRTAPAIVTKDNGSGQALMYDSNAREVDTIRDQDTVILHATGLGPADAAGRVVDGIEVYIGDRKARVVSAGLASGLPGIYEVSVIAAAPATDRLYIRAGVQQSNIAYFNIGAPLNIGTSLNIGAGGNVTNVRGAIDGLNPSSDPLYPTTPQRPCLGEKDPGPCGPTGAAESLPVILHAGTFEVSFDIVPGASPFLVAAVGEGGGTIITIDPAAGTYTASVTTPLPAVRAGDFSSSGITPLWDYPSCDWKSAVCLPFPGNIVPATRIPPWYVRALQILPRPNTLVSGSANALLEASGSLTGSRFAIDNQENSSLSTFGGFVPVPYGPFLFGISRFSLYVDGRLIASRDLLYLPFQRAPARYGSDDF